MTDSEKFRLILETNTMFAMKCTKSAIALLMFTTAVQSAIFVTQKGCPLGHDNIEHQPDRINWFEVDTRDWDTLELLPGWKDHNLTEVEVNRLWFQSGCTEKKHVKGTECYKKTTIRFDRP